MGKKYQLSKCNDPQLRDAITRAKDAVIGEQRYHYGEVLYPPPEARFAGAVGII